MNLQEIIYVLLGATIGGLFTNWLHLRNERRRVIINARIPIWRALNKFDKKKGVASIGDSGARPSKEDLLHYRAVAKPQELIKYEHHANKMELLQLDLLHCEKGPMSEDFNKTYKELESHRKILIEMMKPR